MTFRVVTFNDGLIDEEIVSAASLADVATDNPLAMGIVNLSIEENALEATDEIISGAIDALQFPEDVA